MTAHTQGRLASMPLHLSTAVPAHTGPATERPPAPVERLFGGPDRLPEPEWNRAHPDSPVARCRPPIVDEPALDSGALRRLTDYQLAELTRDVLAEHQRRLDLRPTPHDTWSPS